MRGEEIKQNTIAKKKKEIIHHMENLENDKHARRQNKTTILNGLIPQPVISAV